MFDKFHEECAVVAIHGHPEAANLAYLSLYAMQHRGQESAGLAVSGGKEVVCHKAMGHVADIFTPETLGRLQGDHAIGHTRYSTAGDSAHLNAQPFLVKCNKGRIAVAHNGNITNAAELRDDLERGGAIFQATSDTEVVLHLMAHSRERTLAGALREALLQLEGAYSIVLLAEDRIIVARDPHGFRPLAMGQMELSGGRSAYVFASETCAFDLIGAVYLNDVEPGEMVIAGPDGVTRERFSPRRNSAHCVFEHVYFARPDSKVFGRSVLGSRLEMGRRLARESPVPADVVVPVPDSGIGAALGYAEESGLPYAMGLVRNHYIGRTFIEPKQKVRSFGVRIKLNPVREVLEGKRVILIDDSIVRGTTSRKIVDLIRSAGAAEVHLRISSPPTTHPCHYGIDTPRRSELIASSQTVEQIREKVGADTLAYLSQGGLISSVGDTHGTRHCLACFTGKYAVPVRDEETVELFPLAVSR